MAKITTFQLEELQREAKFQLRRLRNELSYFPTKQPPGLLKSKRRFLLLLQILTELQRDGILVVDNSEEEEVDAYADGTSANSVK